MSPSHATASRGASPDIGELRGNCPKALLSALDALAMARNMDRTSYVNSILTGHVEDEVHKASVLVRTLRGNPFLPEDIGGTSE